MLKKRGESQIKLIDFGLSRMIHPGVPVKDMIGTPEFVGRVKTTKILYGIIHLAPEVVNYESLSTATDMVNFVLCEFIEGSLKGEFSGQSALFVTYFYVVLHLFSVCYFWHSLVLLRIFT